mgnify:FL=1
MKAHIQTQFPPKILFYAIKPGSEKERALAGLCREEGILWEEVPAGRLGDPLGLLAGLAGFSPSLAPWEKELPAREAMVFCGLEEKKVRQLLGKMGEAQLQVELKAVMTPHNQRWPFGALLGELEKEHLALHRR